MIYRLRIWLARKILPPGWAAFENRSSFLDDFAGEIRTLMTDARARGESMGYFTSAPSMAYRFPGAADQEAVQEQEREAADLQVRDDGG